ncbi:hypothetical protein [Candidatus Sarmatiella mevalonica]|uniref:hypothetical protein n=1 Tax=Candidatus Sarmatiella mevalonica TaxID=2770581 RepID=UPI001921CB06|nr:hypothetical protein [Candidatus Sarmatiella mevalonica]
MNTGLKSNTPPLNPNPAQIKARERELERQKADSAREAEARGGASGVSRATS